jgi:hypothetical protein
MNLHRMTRRISYFVLHKSFKMFHKCIETKLGGMDPVGGGDEENYWRRRDMLEGYQVGGGEAKTEKWRAKIKNLAPNGFREWEKLC